MTTDEKLELEQVPLKSGEGGETPKKTTTTATTTSSKSWFFSKSNKKAAAAADAPATTDAEAGGAAPVSEKKPCWWSRCRNNNANNNDANAAENANNGALSIGVNLTDRDEHGIAEQARLEFSDLFGEPDTAHSWDCVWRTNHYLFSSVNRLVYNLLALILVVPVSLIAGVLLALLVAVNNWIVVPVGRLLSVPLSWLFISWRYLVRNAVEPVTRAIGAIFAPRQQALANASTAECIA